MAVIWGTNYSIIKTAFRELDPQAFNALRMIVASLVVPGRDRRRSGCAPSLPATEPPIDRGVFYTPRQGDRARLAAPGRPRRWSATCCYQYLLHRRPGAHQRRQQLVDARRHAGADRAAVSAVLGLRADRPAATGSAPRCRWPASTWSSASGFALGGARLRRRPADVRRGVLLGDLHAGRAAADGAAFAGGGHRPVDGARHADLRAAGLAEAARRGLVEACRRWTWASLIYSALFALCVSYTIWYVAVRQIGSARTSVYSNLFPSSRWLTAVLFLDEPLGAEAARRRGRARRRRADPRRRLSGICRRKSEKPRVREMQNARSAHFVRLRPCHRDP